MYLRLPEVFNSTQFHNFNSLKSGRDEESIDFRNGPMDFGNSRDIIQVQNSMSGESSNIPNMGAIGDETHESSLDFKFGPEHTATDIIHLDEMQDNSQATMLIKEPRKKKKEKDRNRYVLSKAT